MITLRRASERHFERVATRRHRSESWLSFAPELGAAPSAEGFGSLHRLTECRLPPGGSREQPPQLASELLLYVVEGALANEGATGGSGAIHTGEFQQRTSSGSDRHRVANASSSEEVHFFQLRFDPQPAGGEPGPQQQRFTVADRRNGLLLVASPDARQGSLGLRLDALVSSGLLAAGKHVVHAIAPGRGAWLQVVEGELRCADLVLTTGDGLGVACEPALSFTAREASEVLVIDLPVPPQGPSPGSTP